MIARGMRQIRQGRAKPSTGNSESYAKLNERRANRLMRTVEAAICHSAGFETKAKPSGLKRVLLKRIATAEYEFWLSDYMFEYDPYRFPEPKNREVETIYGEVPDYYIPSGIDRQKKSKWVHIRIIYNILKITETEIYKWGPRLGICH